MQLVATPDPAKLASGRITDFPGECSKLAECYRCFWVFPMADENGGTVVCKVSHEAL
jgi:hypothetical protein